jgi:uncharacterized protein (DUF885 family)
MQRGMSVFLSGPMPGRLEVSKVAAYQEAGASLAWAMPGSADGKRPGRFYINLRDPDNWPRFAVRTVAFHEGLPGHLYQMATANSLKGLPTARRLTLFSAYTEGWALFSERMAWEHGFQQDPCANLGRLQEELTVAVNAVLDTGIHHRRWSREEAATYLREKLGLSDAEALAKADRCVITPGQLSSYLVGLLKMLELRDLARQAQGPSFDIRAFNRMILEKGCLPLEILERTLRTELGQPQAR